jgi:uncharacterized protein YpbB
MDNINELYADFKELKQDIESIKESLNEMKLALVKDTSKTEHRLSELERSTEKQWTAINEIRDREAIVNQRILKMMYLISGAGAVAVLMFLDMPNRVKALLGF